ncbi:MAG: hypothetical protein K2G75_02060 [Muribaculaceae bacterium]|nr:hypothetical protein [Muribaculaceae bacterium]MDE5924084.1 hypothetical protein [Muribaculaceae bacterium]MDE6329489.1 hypothetical protein [Muribaculaceae bacterium]
MKKIVDFCDLSATLDVENLMAVCGGRSNKNDSIPKAKIICRCEGSGFYVDLPKKKQKKQ